MKLPTWPILLALLSSCLPTQDQIILGERIINGENSGNHNASYALPLLHSRVIKESPVLIFKTAHPDDSLYKFLDHHPVFITDKDYLEYDCQLQEGGGLVANCMEVKQNEFTSKTKSLNQIWAYHPDSKEFLEVNTFYHSKKSIESFFQLQRSSLAIRDENFDTLSPLPQNSQQNFWFDSDQNTPLKIYTDCQKSGRPFFLLATREVCMGEHTRVRGLNFSEDPSILHHEIGHFFSTTLFNQRNIASSSLPKDRRVSLGGYGYSEADLISEGLSDWFAHNISGRTQVFEWAGGFIKVDRPLTEGNPLHRENQIGLSDQGPYLSYPEYINYYHYDTTSFLPEDVQQAGMIVSHFMLALARELQNTCQIKAPRSRELVFHLVQQTLNELGDLNAKGHNSATHYTINMAPEVSDTWVKYYTPPNVRLFAQKIGKHFLRTINGRPACQGVLFTQDKLEQIIDRYGLLLFKTYNENGNCDSPQCQNQNYTSINTINKKVSILLLKSNLQLDSRENQPLGGFFLFDNQVEIKQRLNSLRARGSIRPQDLGQINLTSTDNNNGNQKAGPGEIIGIALNLFNNSHLPMGGIQTLANDWDHIKMTEESSKMCSTFEDNFPSVSEGGAPPDSLPLKEGDCGYITRENGQKILETKETIAPICFILHKGENETRWISQKDYMKATGDHPDNCLKTDHPLSCYFRAIPGADQAWYSKLAPSSNWIDTYSRSHASKDGNLEFEGSNIMLFEINKRLPPGSQINCRFRARFTNCDDCWHDPLNSSGDDYLDYEYAGNRPYRIFNINLTILD